MPRLRDRHTGAHRRGEKREVVARRVDPYHIGFALERRPGVGWQDLARMLGVNADDLRRACERHDPSRASAEPVGRIVRRSREHRALAALALGCGRYVALAAALEVAPNDARALAIALQAKGLVIRNNRRCELTPAGEAELARVDGGGR